MTPTETLRHEHEIILKVLGAAEEEAVYIEGNGQVHGDRVEKMVDFFRQFADRCHHAKEEKLLFTMMQERGMPVEGGPIGVMLVEHDEGRRRVRGVADALPAAKARDGKAIALIAENLRAFVDLLRAHIDKEDHVLYPMADQMFSAEDQQELARKFERVEIEEMGAGTHEKYHQLAHRLAGA